MEIINTEKFDEVIKEGLVIVDNYADWCGPCKMIMPTLEQLASDYEGKCKIVKVNVDNDPEIAKRFDITSIPHLLVFKDGQLINRAVGYQTKDNLVKLIESGLN